MGAFFFLFLILICILGFCALVGAVMFCVDIWKWSKRPEVYTTVEEDLNKNSNTKTNDEEDFL